MSPTVDLSRASYGQVLPHNYQMAILPWGATEPHNYHLPYTTDAILSHAIAVDAAKHALKHDALAMVLPPITLGSQNPGQRELPFCIHSRYETQKAILQDVVDSLQQQGFNKLLIVNGHGGNSFKNMLRDMAVTHPQFFIATCEWYALAPSEHIFEHKGEHAHELETSVMLHYHKELVPMEMAGAGNSKKPLLKPLAEGTIWAPRNWSEISEDTGIGDPRDATAEKGRVFALAVVKKLSEVIVSIVQHTLVQ
ncbi:MAG: creatininase family protein [Bacteroidales bacterium]